MIQRDQKNQLPLLGQKQGIRSKSRVLPMLSAYNSIQGVDKPPKLLLQSDPQTHPTFPYVRNQLTPARGAIKQENLFLVLAPCCCSRGPIKALPEFLVWLQVNFYESGKVKNPDQYQNYPL